jgi:RecA/RadA recombinase
METVMSDLKNAGNAKKYLSQLRKMEGAVIPGQWNPLANCLRTPMPSVNWAFGIEGHGLPYGYSMILYGPPKGGKSIVCNAIAGQMHKDLDDSIAITFNTELRGEAQANQQQMATWGIDPDRFAVFDVNQPELIFDRIETDIAAMCQSGANIKLVVIDSLKGIVGRRTMNAESVMQQQIGDEAATLQDGLKRILPTIRKYKIALIMTTHVRAELDPMQQKLGKTVKMAGAWASKHMAEIFAYVEPNKWKAGKTSLAGEEFTDPSVVDFMEKSQATGHKIRFRIEESSIGPSGRTAEFTLDYNKGIINTHEEVFTLAKNYGILERPNNQWWHYNGKKWNGIVNMLTAIRDDRVLYNELLDAVMAKDKIQGFKETPAEAPKA